MFSTVLGLIENLTTAGAADLIDFIKGFLIGLGILMFERIYINYLVNFIVDVVIKLLDKLYKFIKKLFKNEEDNFEELK